jgi:biotin carboxyl carrier protein
MKKLRVTVEGKAYEVMVELLDEPESTRPPPSARTSVAADTAPAATSTPPLSPAETGDGGKVIISPLSGRVVSLEITVGQTFAAGTQVATLEAMKMNTFVYADCAGTVAALLVMPGTGVEEGAPLIRLV